MRRSIDGSARWAIAVAVAIAAALPAAAFARPVPADRAEVGRLQIGVFPEATLDGRPVRLGAGARIYNEHSAIVMPASVQGERHVAYLRGAMGEIVEVWLISAEQARKLAAAIEERKRSAPAWPAMQPRN
ncbi:MAG TPA: hypothetical protein VM491_21835 [Burkholderiaceae bacterium]|nr:hypothetical protein [Burkholderiaceae bacterium]